MKYAAIILGLPIRLVLGVVATAILGTMGLLQPQNPDWQDGITATWSWVIGE